MIVRCIVFFMFSSYVVIWNKDKIARTRRCVLFAEKTQTTSQAGL